MTEAEALDIAHGVALACRSMHEPIGGICRMCVARVVMATAEEIASNERAKSAAAIRSRAVDKGERS